MGKREAASEEKKTQVCRSCATGPFSLRKAACCGHVDCLKALLPKGKNSEKAAVEILEEQFALHAAAEAGQLDSLKYLIESTKISPYHRNPSGATCAHVATYVSSFECLQYLLNMPTCRGGRRPLALEKDARGNTILHLAVFMDNNDIAIWLLQRYGQAITNISNDAGQLAVHIAAAQENVEFIRIATNYDLKMVNKKDCDGATPAFYAARGGNLKSLQYLVEKTRSDLNALTNRGHTLLHVACLAGHTQVVEWLLTKMKKSSILQTNQDYATAFHFAAFGGHTGILKMLQRHTNNKKYLISSVDRRGNTPLHLAAMNGHVDCIEFLLEVGADPKIKNKSSFTAVDMAGNHGHYQIAWLLSSYKKARGKSKSGQSHQSPRTVSSSGFGSIAAPLSSFGNPTSIARPPLTWTPWSVQPKRSTRHQGYDEAPWNQWFVPHDGHQSGLSPVAFKRSSTEDVEHETITRHMVIGETLDTRAEKRQSADSNRATTRRVANVSRDHLSEGWSYSSNSMPANGKKGKQKIQPTKTDRLSNDSVSISLSSPEENIDSDACIAATEHIDRVLEEMNQKDLPIQNERSKDTDKTELGPPLSLPIFYDSDTAKRETSSKMYVI